METFALAVFYLFCLEYGIRVLKLVTGTPLAVPTRNTYIADTILGLGFVAWGMHVLF